jgi:hypothetical protein
MALGLEEGYKGRAVANVSRRRVQELTKKNKKVR